MSHHFDTPTARDDPRINVCDLYVFPGKPGTTVMAMTVNPDAGVSAPTTFRDGAVYSAQSVELTMSPADLDRLWNPANLENLGRTYWRFLSRVTLGLIRVIYGENERSAVLFARPFRLLRFEAPQYTFEDDHGNISWRIRDGLLVSRRGRGCGFGAAFFRRREPFVFRAGR